VTVSDVYIRRDLAGIITPNALIIDNLIYFLSNGNATLTVNIDFTCDTYISYQEITVGFSLNAMYCSICTFYSCLHWEYV